MKYLIKYVLAVAALSFATSAFAVTPNDVADLVGAKGAGGETQLMQRGYINIKMKKGTQYWWNDALQACIGVRVADGRYKTISGEKPASCDQKADSAKSSNATAPTSSAKPSFNCKKASHEIEKLICGDQELAELDVSLSSLYSTLLKHTAAKDQRSLKTEQSGWMKGRNDCWKADDKRACVKSEYESRISVLKDR